MKKEHLTIAEALDKKQIKQPSGFIWFIYSILARTPFFGGKYHVTYKVIDDINKEKGPAFIIWNHQSRRDYLFVKNITRRRRYNMVAGYNEFFKSHLRPLFNKVQIIPKKNFTQDVNSIRMINKIIKENGTICFAPEGMSSIYGCQQPLVPGTGRFLKYYKIPVYFMKLEGAYLTSHKASTEDRPGKVFATISKLFTSEDLEKLSQEEIENKINEVFWQDDYEWNKTKRIKYKTRGNAANNMSSLAYKCPKCGKEMTMRDDHNKLYCENCGNGCTINDYYDFVPFDNNSVVPESLTKWIELERKDLIQEIRKDKNYSMEFNCKVGELPKYELVKDYKSSILCGEGKFRIDHEGLHFEGVKNNEPWKFDLSYQVIYTLIITDKTDMFNLYVDGEYYDFIPEDIRCVGKALLLTEEMHRLHVNIWKNFPWMNHLYKGTELEKK